MTTDTYGIFTFFAIPNEQPECQPIASAIRIFRSDRLRTYGKRDRLAGFRQDDPAPDMDCYGQMTPDNEKRLIFANQQQTIKSATAPWSIISER